MSQFMKLGIITYGHKADDFSRIRKKGLDFVEFCINSDEDQFLSNLAQIQVDLKNNQLQVASIGRWGTNRITETGLNEEELAISFRLIDACEMLGCPVFVVGCNYVDTLSRYDNITYAIEYFKQLIAYGKTKNVQIATYNCHWNSFVVDPGVWELIHGHLDDLFIKYDPSHCIYDGSGEYLAEINKWGHRIIHFHLKGALSIDGKRVDDPPAGLDEVNWQAVIALLIAKGYKGVFSIEPHSHIWTGDIGEAGINYTINYFKQFNF